MNKVFGTLDTKALHTKQNCIRQKQQHQHQGNSRDRKSNVSLSPFELTKKCLSRKKPHKGIQEREPFICLERKVGRVFFVDNIKTSKKPPFPTTSDTIRVVISPTCILMFLDMHEVFFLLIAQPWIYLITFDLPSRAQHALQARVAQYQPSRQAEY